MRHQIGPEHIVRDMLIVAAGDQNDLLLEGAQPRNGTGGAGTNGIIVVFDAVQLPYQFNTVLHAAEALGKFPDDFIRHQTVHRTDGGHIVFDIMDTGQENIPDGQDRTTVTVLLDADRVVLNDHALIHGILAGEQGHMAGCLGGKGVSNLIVAVQHHLVPRVLVQENILLGGHIFLHALVNVQMVGCDVGDHSDLRAGGHTHKLERGQFQHRHIFRLHVKRLCQQRMADIAAQMDGIARLFHQLGDDGRGRSLAVAAGHCDLLAGADIKKHFHLAGHFRPPSNRRFKGRHIRTDTRRAEDQVGVDAVHVALAQMQFDPQRFQLFSGLTQSLPGIFVTGGDGNAVGAQHLNERNIAHADAEYIYFFIADRIQILLNRHFASLQ